MKTMTLVLVLAAAVGCSKDKAKTTKAPESTQPPAAHASVPTEQLEQDQVVSPGLAISGDILAACGITAISSPNPTFDYDKDELTAEDRQILDQIATCLITGALKGKAVSLIGRADPRGTEEYNLGLGSRRAASVSQYLARLGVTGPQLAVTTRGAIDATGVDESTWRQDRRVDIQLQ